MGTFESLESDEDTAQRVAAKVQEHRDRIDTTQKRIDSLTERLLMLREKEDALALAGEEGRAIKCSTRDLPLVASKHCNMRSALEGNNDQWGGMLWYILKFSLACFFGLFQVDIDAESSYIIMQLQPQP